MNTYKTLEVSIDNHIATVTFNRPHKANSLTTQAWHDLKAVFEGLDEIDDVRVIVLNGNGKHFCGGIDLSVLMGIRERTKSNCEGRIRENVRKMVFELQAPINAIEACSKPVIAAIHGGCIGAGVDIVCACDMRYVTHSGYFTIKEIDMGMVADLGTLQRMPKLIGDAMVRELAYTGRKMYGEEAKSIGFVNKSSETREEMMEEVMKVAALIASKSPLSIRGTKEVIKYSREHSIADGLNYMATWNAAMILSNDLNAAFMASMQKKKPEFQN